MRRTTSLLISFIDLDTECAGDLLGNLPAAEAEVSPIHLDDRINKFF
jgi:hypothetical protein